MYFSRRYDIIIDLHLKWIISTSTYIRKYQLKCAICGDRNSFVFGWEKPCCYWTWATFSQKWILFPLNFDGNPRILIFIPKFVVTTRVVRLEIYELAVYVLVFHDFRGFLYIKEQSEVLLITISSTTHHNHESLK